MPSNRPPAPPFPPRRPPFAPRPEPFIPLPPSRPVPDPGGWLLKQLMRKYEKPESGIPKADLSAALQAAIDSAYEKPESGIPKTDLSADVQTSLGKADTAVQPTAIAGFVDAATYDSTAKKIFLKHGTTTVAEIDATDFVIDGMVSSVEIEDGNLVITFNTDAGQEPISIPLTDIFNPANYYDKGDINGLMDGKFDKSGGIVTGPVLINSTNSASSPLTLGFNADPTNIQNTVDILRSNDGGIYLRIHDTTLASQILQKLPRQSGTYAIAASEGHAGNLAALDSNGNPTDSGKSFEDIQDQIDTESPLLARSYAVLQQTGWTVNQGSSSSPIYFRPRYFGMKDGDLFKGIVLRTRSTGRTSFPSGVYMRLKRYSDGQMLGVSELTVWPDTANTDVVFRFSRAVELTASGNYYMLDFSETPAGNAVNFGMSLYSLPSGASSPDFYFASSTNVPIATAQFYSWEELPGMESVSWSDLKTLRDGGNLVPGQQYRITDYVATTNGDMESQSANHSFDIIVTADDERTLNEHARAIVHEGDLPDDIVDGSTRTKYFADCDLAAWDVWYCLDNDTTRFAWAVANGGKGVVYRLVDESQNDCPYDFKGIQFKAYGDTDNVWRYTFDSGDASNNADSSKSGLMNGVDKNTISPYGIGDGIIGQWKLNRIVFKGLGSSFNTFGIGCHSNTFGEGCHSNTFGEGCYENMFGIECFGNTFGFSCHSNTFGSSCIGNTFGASYYENTFGGGCSYNTFGANCHSNTFGAKCYNNTFGRGCSYNTFGANCYVGNWSDSSRRYIGTMVRYNNVLHAVLNQYRGSFSTYATYRVGDTLYYQSTYWECTTEHHGSWDAANFTEIQLVGGILSAEEYVPRSRYRNVELEDGVSYVALDCTADRGSADYKNVTVSKGIAGTESAPKHIEDASFNQTFKTTYQPADSRTIAI